MANNYTSIKVVADRLLRHPLMAGVSFEAILDYTVDFLRIVQCYGFFEEKCAVVDIEDYRGLLPEDFYEMNQMRLISSSKKMPTYEMSYRTDENGDFVLGADGNKIPNGFYVQTGYEDSEEYHNTTFRYATDTFHMSDTKTSTDLTYKIQGGIIYTSIKEGQIEIAYQALVLDTEGYPVIPDNAKFLRALEAYIKLQWFTILFDMGKLQSAIYQNAQQDYAWAVGACESEFQKMSLDKAESFYNSFSALLMKKNAHSRGFAYNGARENLKLV